MNVKKIGLMGGGFIASFLVMVMIAYLAYPYINPEKKEEIEANMPVAEGAKYDAAQYEIEAVEKLKQKIINLEQLTDSLQQREQKHVAKIDSLSRLLEKERQQKQEIKAEIPDKVSIKNLEQVSKSLLNLDEGALAPIVNLLDEKQLVDLYNSASNIQREKLLRSLKPEMAAKILKEVMS